MADRINLPRTIVDRANNLFKQVHDGKNLKGRSNDAIASASLYIACRQEGVPRTFKEICAVSKISKKEIGRCFKLILKALETSVDLITTGDFMSRFCANLSKWNICYRNFMLLLIHDYIYFYYLQVCLPQFKRLLHTLLAKLWNWILYQAGHPFQWLQQPSTWPHKLLMTKEHRKKLEILLEWRMLLFASPIS